MSGSENDAQNEPREFFERVKDQVDESEDCKLDFNTKHSAKSALACKNTVEKSGESSSICDKLDIECNQISKVPSEENIASEKNMVSTEEENYDCGSSSASLPSPLFESGSGSSSPFPKIDSDVLYVRKYDTTDSSENPSDQNFEGSSDFESPVKSVLSDEEQWKQRCEVIFRWIEYDRFDLRELINTIQYYKTVGTSPVSNEGGQWQWVEEPFDQDRPQSGGNDQCSRPEGN